MQRQPLPGGTAERAGRASRPRARRRGAAGGPPTRAISGSTSLGRPGPVPGVAARLLPCPEAPRGSLGPSVLLWIPVLHGPRQGGHFEQVPSGARDRERHRNRMIPGDRGPGLWDCSGRRPTAGLGASLFCRSPCRGRFGTRSRHRGGGCRRHRSCKESPAQKLVNGLLGDASNARLDRRRQVRCRAPDRRCSALRTGRRSACGPIRVRRPRTRTPTHRRGRCGGGR